MKNVTVGSAQITISDQFAISAKEINEAAIRFPHRARSFLKFESFPIKDTINGTFVQNIGSESPILEIGAFGNGIRLRPNTILSLGYVPKDRRQLSLGFWWSPGWMRPAVGQNDNLPAYYRSPIVSRSNFSLDLVSGDLTAEDATFVIYEESIENELNRMYILLENPDNEQSVWVSPTYSTGQFHYMWISYDGVQGRIALYIDGIEQSLTLESGSGVPSTLNVNQSVQLRINQSAVGKNSLLRKSFASIDELFVEDARQFDPLIIARHINFGSEYVYDSQLSRREKLHNGFSYDDPSAITVSAAFSNGTNIYTGRTDGQVFKGDRLLWKSRRDFSNRDEINFVKPRYLSTESSVSVDNGALRVSKASVRL